MSGTDICICHKIAIKLLFSKPVSADLLCRNEAKRNDNTFRGNALFWSSSRSDYRSFSPVSFQSGCFALMSRVGHFGPICCGRFDPIFIQF